MTKLGGRRFERGGIPKWVEACLKLPKKRYATMRDGNVVFLRQPDTIDEVLTIVLRSDARRVRVQAIEAEAGPFLATIKGVHLPDGHDRLARCGHGSERQVPTGSGPVAVQQVRLRDRNANEGGERIGFIPVILLRRAWRTSENECAAADPLSVQRQRAGPMYAGLQIRSGRRALLR